MADTFTVTGQQTATSSSPNGLLTPAIQVSFVTKPSGVPGTVTIPISQYTPEMVHDVIAEHARTLEAVQSL